MLEGRPAPLSALESLMVFIQKKRSSPSSDAVICRPSELRPLSLANTDSKIIMSAVSVVLSRVAERHVHPHQRGFISGRQIVDNIFDVEGSAMLHAMSGARDAALILMDYSAAFPSLFHEWIFRILRVMGVPENIVCLISSIYALGPAHVVFKGRRWGAIFAHRGVRQGCPASGPADQLEGT